MFFIEREKISDIGSQIEYEYMVAVESLRW